MSTNGVLSDVIGMLSKLHDRFIALMEFVIYLEHRVKELERRGGD